MSNKYYQDMTDEEIIRLVLLGQNNAFGELYKRYYQKVYFKCLSLASNPDDAFDLTENIMLKVYERLKSFKGNSSFSTWLFTICHNECMDHFRRETRKKESTYDTIFEVEDEYLDSEDLQVQDIKEAKLMQALSQMDNTDKDLLTMKYLDNVKVKEIQLRLGLSASAVKMRLSRARKKLLNAQQ